MKLPTVIAMQIFSIFWIGHAAPPGGQKKDTTEMTREMMNGIAILFSNNISAKLFLLFALLSVLLNSENILEKALWISALENKEQTAAFENNVRKDINCRKRFP